MIADRRIWVLFALFLIANAAYLHRVPGLFGDEGSEGENVYQLLESDRIVVVGERSYIGPLIDYVRTPFVLLFGYNALSLRLVTLLVSIATFWLAATVLRRLFGEAALMAMALLFFSPTYLLKQRLGWAITLFPFFAFLLLFILTDTRLKLPYRSALAGLAAGLGLHNYIVYFPTLVGIGGSWLGVMLMWPAISAGSQKGFLWWMKFLFFFLLGFWAGFGSQFAVLQLFPEDQGEPAEVLSLVGERIAALPSALPPLLSGSAYAARYVGEGYSSITQGVITAILLALVLLAVAVSERRKVALAWLMGLALQLTFLVLMVDRFTLRYFVVFVLGVWALAGIGLHVFTRKLTWLPLAAAIVLIAWTAATVFVPYLKTGGSTRLFSLGRYSDSSADFVDIRPLIACVHKAGPVWADNPHVYNRLLFLSRGDKDIWLPFDRNQANWIVDYRLPGEKAGVYCPELAHFRLTKRK